MTNPMEDPLELKDVWRDFETHRSKEQERFLSRKPRKVGNVLAQLVRLRGYAQIRKSDEQEKVWRAVVGPDLSRVTQFLKLSRGTFHVLLANSLLMQEFTFRKEELLEAVQSALPNAGVKQLRFKVGKITNLSAE